MNKLDREYVGYGTPPKKFQFKKGNVEHLKRRKTRKPDLASIAEQFVEGTVTYRQGSKIKKDRRVDIYLKDIESRSLNGDLQAISTLLEMRVDKLQNFSKLQRTIMVFPEVFKTL